MPVDRFAVHFERNVSHHREAETGRGNDDVGLDLLPGTGAHTVSVKVSRVSVTTVSLPSAAALKTSPSGQNARRCCHTRYFGVKCGSNSKSSPAYWRMSAFSSSNTTSGSAETALGQGILVVHDLGAHDPVNRRLVDADLTQPVRQLVPVLTAEEVGGRTLQHGHVLGLSRQRPESPSRRSHPSRSPGRAYR